MAQSGTKRNKSGTLVERGEGNSSSELIPPSDGRIVPAKYWSWTHHYKGESPGTKMEQFFKKKGWKYFFGHEICPSTGGKHLQGWLGHDAARIRPNEGCELVRQSHWTKCDGSYDQNIEYCSKDATDIRSNVPRIPKPLIDPMEGLEFYPWQQQIVHLILHEKVNPRNIYWFWEPTGKVGKSSLTKHLLMRNNTIMVLSGKSVDIRAGFTSHLEAVKECDAAIFHYVRGEKPDYTAIESIQDGYFFSPKYKSSMQLFNPPHVVCFSNFPPDTGTLSLDRWIVRRIVGHDAIIEEPEIPEEEISLFD